jgi:NTP pyrophosphatase (non-canonical NTP hydrolase)
MTRRRLVPDGVDPNSKSWPLLLAVAVIAEQQMQANAHKDRDGFRRWIEDDPAALMRHLIEEVEEVDAAVAAQQHSVMSQSALGHSRRSTELLVEGGDVVNLVMMVLDRCVGLQPPSWPITVNDPHLILAMHDDSTERSDGGSRTTCAGATLYLLGIQLDAQVDWILRRVNALTQRRAITPEDRLGLLGQRFDTIGAYANGLKTTGQALCADAASEARFAWEKTES